MEGQKVKNVIGVVNNPIGVIGLFLVLVEAIAALVVVNSSLPYSLNLILVLFIVIFPFIVLLVFYLLVTKHHQKLYSPSDYIGSNKGLATKEFIQILIDEIDLPIIVDAGIGRPSQACEAMEMGAAAIMANTALATAGDLPMMASAFKNAIEAGRKAYLSGLGRVLTRGASASDPLTGFLRD